MVSREIHRTPDFHKSLQHLQRKHRDLPAAITKTLKAIAESGVPEGDQIPGLDGRPVYKTRVGFGNVGKRGGARLVYGLTEALVVAMFVYLKSEMENLPTIVIKEAIAAGALEPPQPAPPQTGSNAPFE